MSIIITIDYYKNNLKIFNVAFKKRTNQKPSFNKSSNSVWKNHKVVFIYKINDIGSKLIILVNYLVN